MITSPSSKPPSGPANAAEIEAVFGDGMPGELGESEMLVPARSAKQEWQRYGRFLMAPTLPHSTHGSDRGLAATLRMLVLDLTIMAAFVAILLLVVELGFTLPENLNSTLEMNLTTVALIVVLAPVLEELVFRSWLSGRPRYLGAIAALIASGIVALIVSVSPGGDSGTALSGLSLLAGMIAALGAVFFLWKRPTAGWFRRIFPALFWLSSVAFSLVHLMNYTEGALYVLLPLVIPQLILGTMAAYVRVHCGLIFAILLHAAHNGVALGLAALGMMLGMEG